MTERKYYLAIDIGASSGRHILGFKENGKISTEEIYRFENKQIISNGHVCWDIKSLWKSIIEGMRICGEKGYIPETVGIDTWAVDFVLLDGENNRISDAVAYRDSRTDGMKKEAEKYISASELYSRTGIQYQPFNTIYQLLALKKESPEQLQKAEHFLMIPEYFNYLLCGVLQNEYTNSTSTGLVDARTRTWDRELIERLDLPDRIFGETAMPGTVLGNLRKDVAEKVGFDTRVILPATHDTASAFLAVPAKDENAVYISSGTWSLLGVENSEPITSEESRLQNFTNEGGAWYRYRYLKNIMGLWMVQSIKREKSMSFEELMSEAGKCPDFRALIDVNKERFLAPVNMEQEICQECMETGQPVPQTIGEIMQCIYRSLAECYKNAVKSLEKLTGKRFTSINVVGGGCQDEYLNRYTAEATGLPLYVGPVEGTAIGNLMVQMIEGGEFAGLQEARDAVRAGFEIREVKP